MSKLPECVGVSRGGAIAVSSLARNPHLICAVHPTGSDTDTCPDFWADPNAEPDEVWEAEGASYYGGELILQPRQRWTPERKTVRTFGYPPTVYWPVSPMWNDLPPVWNAACSLGLFGLRMDRWFGLRWWLTTIIISNGKILARHPPWKCSQLIPQQTPKTRLEAAQLTTQSHEAMIARSETWAHFCWVNYYVTISSNNN